MNHTGIADNAGLRPDLSREQIKYLAIAAMTCNHAAHALLPAGSPLYRVLIYIGYFTAPVKCRFLVDGYRLTRSKKRYALRLFLASAAAQVPYVYATGFRQLNILFTLLLCLLLITVMDHVRDPLLKTAAAVAAVACSVPFDWGGLLPGAAALFHMAGEDRKKQIRAYAAVVILFGILQALSLSDSPLYAPSDIALEGIFSMLGPAAGGLCLFGLYHGRSAARFQRFHKCFFYVYYPAHLIILSLLKMRLR